MTVLLDVQNVTMHFVWWCRPSPMFLSRSWPMSFSCLIGPNGAGKTTMLKAITGVVHPQTAQITLNGEAITTSPHVQADSHGAGVDPPDRAAVSLHDLKGQCGPGRGGNRRIRNIFGAMVSSGRHREHKRAVELLDLVGIGEHADQEVTGQPLGVLKRLEVARALALEPKLLLLDEPLAGLNQIEAQRLADTMALINQKGMTIVMIEHNLSEVLRVGQRLVVLDNGRKIAEGEPRQVMHRPDVRAAYVGKGAEDVTA